MTETGRAPENSEGPLLLEQVLDDLCDATEGPSLSVGDIIVEAEDDAFPPGLIELRFSGRCNIWLDDFAVTGAEVPDGGPGRGRSVRSAKTLATTWGNLKVLP